MELPDDCINIIFLFVDELLDLYNLSLSCSYFNKGFSKDFIKKKFIYKSAFIRNYFPEPIIELAGGIHDMLFYPIFDNELLKWHQYTFFIEFTKNIQLKHMKYPIMIGRYQEKSFIAFVLKSSKKSSFKGMIRECSTTEINYYVLTIYQRYGYFESSWYTTEKNVFNSDLKYLVNHGQPIAAFKRGYFDIIDQGFKHNILQILWKNKTTLLTRDNIMDFVHTYSILGVVPNRYNPLKISHHFKI